MQNASCKLHDDPVLVEAMTWPAWTPPPETKGLSLSEAAILRSKYRIKMAMRWRNPELRELDRSEKKLPMTWHEWMHCPALKGYLSPGCTCDSWMNEKSRPSQHPREKQRIQHRDRQRLHYLRQGIPPDMWQDLENARSAPELVEYAPQEIPTSPQCVFRVWLPVIDMSTNPRMVATRHEDHQLDQGLFSDGAISSTRPVDAGSQEPAITERASRQDRIRQPAWAEATRHHLSIMRVRSS